jgi:CheY-like chemotaxis protein
VARRIVEQSPSAAPAILMLTSVGASPDLSRAAAHGVTATITKPVRQAVLKAAVQSALARRPVGADTAEATAPAGTVPPPRPRAATARRLRVLVAEDNSVNQRLFRAMLAKHGHDVTVVDNGSAAVEAAASGTFDVALMDLQMPVMGGLEATALIREAEAGTDHHLPIVALTAHALAGDRERCLDAGMDQYLSKPVQAPVLLGMLQEITGGQPATESAAPPAIAPDDVLARVDGDRELLAELLAIFHEQARELIAALDEAVASSDAVQVEQLAHTLRGSVANFGAREAVRLAQTLELAARGGDLGEAAALVAQLRSETTAVEVALADLSGGPT